MAKLTEKEIEQLQQELKEKTEEIKAIYDKLMEVGDVPLSDDILDTIAGGRDRDCTIPEPTIELPPPCVPPRPDDPFLP